MRHSDLILEELLSLHPKRIDLTLNRVLALLAKLGNPQDNLPPVVHIAGTNGKGSTLAFIQAIAEDAGLEVHRYSSPHLVRFHERIILAGETIAESALSALLSECENVQDGEPITFFEITTAAAFLAFSRTPADLLLLETGLGGRLDATNVIKKPAMNILSRLGIDHQDFLGNTIQDIAAEKVAIARTGVPLVVGKQTEDALSVIQDYATQHAIPTHIAGDEWSFSHNKTGVWQWQSDDDSLKLPQPSLHGVHQYENAALAVSAIKILQKQNFNITDAHIASGLSQTVWAGRMQKLHTGKWRDALPSDVQLWVDGGHNIDAAQVLADALANLEEPRLIIGMLSNKDCSGFLGCVAPYLAHGQSITIPDEASAYPAEAIAELHPALRAAADFEDALQYAHESGAKNILLCGSLYLVGAFLGQNSEK